ncbi:MAG TPA: cobalamin-dependent protein [Desulfobaccales bacterium]
MKVLLIQPSRFREDGSLDKRKRRWLLGMTLPYVAALVPKDIQVEIKDDLLEEITFQEKCDLVGLSFMSHQAPRAYQLAAGFRRRGIPVVMGGFHATLAPEECREHADAIVLGEAEEAWPRLLGDFQAGRLQSLYKAEALSDLRNLPVPRYDLLNLKKYKLLNIPSQTTRGCPYACNYCEVTQVYGGKFRHRPMEEVIHEIQEIRRLTGSDFIYFVDDNFVANRRHALAILQRLTTHLYSWHMLPFNLIYAWCVRRRVQPMDFF